MIYYLKIMNPDIMKLYLILSFQLFLDKIFYLIAITQSKDDFWLKKFYLNMFTRHNSQFSINLLILHIY